MAKFEPPTQVGRCDRCRKKTGVRTFQVVIDDRTALSKKLCDECWPSVLSGVITMIH